METILSPSITLTNLTKKYRSTFALKNIDLTLPQNAVIGLVGPSGAGKTTFLKLIAHLVSRYKGTLNVFDAKPNENIKSILSFCPEVSPCDTKTTAEDLISLLDNCFNDFDLLKAYRLMQEQHINPFIPIRSLPLTQQRLLFIILTLSRHVRLYLIDDPFKAMNESDQKHTIAFLKETLPPASTILVASEFVQHIEKLLDHVVFLQEGCLMGSFAISSIRIPFKRLYDEVMVR